MSNKVRIACRRCRSKRIKCDGSIPACGNCQKANEPCVDVDGRNKTLSIPRDFAANAKARVDWLEEHIQRLLPDFNFRDGPQVDFSFLDAAGGVPSPALRDPTQPSITSSHESYAATGKRTYASISQQPAHEHFADEARSVALDLGLLTLNSDSRQTHYLGTSSGRLFSSLIGAGSPDTPTTTRSSRMPNQLSYSSPGTAGPIAYAKRTKDSCRMLYESLQRNLPSEDDSQILLETYFRNIHVYHPFLHPASLISAVESLYRCAVAGTDTEIGYNGWPSDLESFSYNGEHDISRNSHCTPVSVFTAAFHVFMVYTLASIVRTRQRVYDFAPKKFYRVALSTVQHCFATTSISSLQATLLLAVYSLHSPAELNIWTLTYVAMAHCIDLGLHRAPSTESNISPAALLTRKMVFFSVYHLDRSIAAIQGRPLGIRDETFDLELPKSTDIEADIVNIEGRAFAPDVSLGAGLTFAIHRFKLDPIISEIKLLFYHLPSQKSAYAWPQDQRSLQLAIQAKLEDWRLNLTTIASTMGCESEYDRQDHRKYELKLTSQYFAAVVLLYQPSQTIPCPSEQALLICYQCAASRLNTYNDLYYAESFYPSWRSVQGIFSAGATMIYCLWTSALVRSTITTAEAIRDMRTCTNLLSVGGEWWPSVKKGKESFARAMDALLRRLDSSQTRIHSESSQNGQPLTQRSRMTTHPQTHEQFTAPGTNMAGHPIVQDTHGTFHQSTLDAESFSQMATDFTTSDWTVLNDPAFNYDTQRDLSTVLDSSTESTVEAFIAEFLNNDTAWNPF